MQYGDRPALNRLIARVLDIWPDHRAYVAKSFDGRPEKVLDVGNEVSGLVLRLAEHQPRGIDGLCEDYRFLCEQIVMPEELHFRREGRYRLQTFEQANAGVYANREFMTRYMAGLLVSDVLWDPHARAFEYYVDRYLASLKSGADHLEIGPGHGLLLFFAARQQHLGKVVGWDISPASIDLTREALTEMGTCKEVELKLQNLFDPDPEASFDSIVLSEILEHLEDPQAALKSVRSALRPGGMLWINVPANSPAPDHLYLLRTPEEACALVHDAGFEVIDHAFFPMSGYSLEAARKRNLSISCVVTARKA